MDKIDEVLTRGVEQVLPSKNELASLMKKRRIRIYQGFDPTGTQLHIGHAVGFRKLRQFQELGHEVIFLIGDGTGQAGDPSGKKVARDKFFNSKELKKNAKSYLMQASKIVRFDGSNPVKILYNSSWLNKLKLVDVLDIAGHFSLQQMLERDLYQERLKSGVNLSLREFMYPLLQGYDSVAMKVDLEIGGNDQLFNMLAGRKLVKEYLNKDKFVLTVPLLTDSNGVKIGKSEGNVVGLTDKPNDFFGKIMALPDSSIINCFTLLTDMPLNEIDDMQKRIADGKNPIYFKKQLAFELTRWLNDEEKAKKAALVFENTFSKHKPEFSQEIKINKSLVETIAPYTNLKSVSDAKRLIQQGGLTINGDAVSDLNYKIKKGDKVKIGKKVFGKLI